MQRQRARIYVTLAVVFGSWLFRSSPARAESECTSPKLNLITPEGDQWKNAAEELGEYLRALGDLDRCARVIGRPDGASVVLEITTGDGRTATRRVESVTALLRTCEALLILPPTPPTTPKTAPASNAEIPPKEPTKAAVLSATRHVEFGVGGSLRIGGGPLYAGGGISTFAAFELESWLLSLSARWDAVEVLLTEPTLSDFYMQSEAVGASAGRRFTFASVNVDALVGPNIVLESQDADDGEREVHGAAADFRLGFAVRVSGPRVSSVRAYLSADLEASPARIRRSKMLDRALPTVPAWSSGLAAGVAWGSP